MKINVEVDDLYVDEIVRLRLEEIKGYIVDGTFETRSKVSDTRAILRVIGMFSAPKKKKVKPDND